MSLSSLAQLINYVPVLWSVAQTPMPAIPATQPLFVPAKITVTKK